MSIVDVQFTAPASGRLEQLRELLSEKFPAAPLKPAGILPTGLSSLDEAEGGLRKGAITELVGPLSAGGLFIENMLGVLLRQQCCAALVDAGGSFDPCGCYPMALRRLLWVPCKDAEQAMKVTDLLLRDGNLPLVVLDLQMTGERQLRRIAASTWHRFQRLLEPVNTTLVVLSNKPMVEAAQVRVSAKVSTGLAFMKQRRRVLLEQLLLQVFPRRRQIFSARELVTRIA